MLLDSFYNEVVFVHIDMLSIGGSSRVQLYPPYLAQIWGFWVTCGVKMMSLLITSLLRLTATTNCFPHPSQT